MTPRQIQFLLEELCVDLGFCLAPDAQALLLREPPAGIDAFTDAVIRAEGLDPDAIARRLRRKVRERVQRHFERSCSA
jgi:hypothetical protein